MTDFPLNYHNQNLERWAHFFIDRGLSEDVFSSYLPYIQGLVENNVPIIFEFEHLSKLLGIKNTELAKMINSPASFYRSFQIPKRNKGKREITAPYPSLLNCQRWIYRHILLPQPVHSAAHGFVPGRSIISNASAHLSQKCLLKMDFEDFFPSIPINWVIKLFNTLGYALNVSFYLASLCCYDETLSQGSATSPYITNILLRNLDERLYKLGKSYSLKFTRYADDIAFSGDYIPYKYIDIVTDIIEDFGLDINSAKTILHTKPGRRIVTGLSVAGNELKLPRNTKRMIRKDLYFIERFGFLSHMAKKKISNPFYIDSLKGKLLFWRQIEPNNKFIEKGLRIVDKVLSSTS